MNTCACDATLNNTGTPTCNSLMDVAEMLILVPKYDSNGALNYIDLTATLNQAYFDGKINAANKEDRWFPLPRHKNATSTKADSVFQTWDDNSKELIREGLRSWSVIFPKQTPTFLGKLKNWRCDEFGLYIIDKTGNLIGSLDATNKLYPIAVEAASWNPVFVYTTPTSVQQISLGFDFDQTALDENLQIILAADLGAVKLLNLKGLIDVFSTVSSITTTGFTVELWDEYGDALNPGVVKNLTAVDFISSVGGATSKVRNQTDAADVAITATESPDGTYAIAYSAQTSADVLILKPSAAGFDFSAVEAATITIP